MINLSNKAANRFKIKWNDLEDRSTEWSSYLKQLKATHKRKTRLMEVLDRLEKSA